MHWLSHMVQTALAHWGYLALAAGLVGEDAGLPLPGETVLMLASFTAHKTHSLSLWWVIVVGIAAAVVGDNLGFWAGRKLGPRLLRWARKKLHMGDDIEVASDLLHRHGAATVYWARFIFGLREITGPVAGALGMEWKEFLLYNFLGGATWVVFISLVGYLFATQFNSLVDYFEKASLGISAAMLVTGYILWRREKKHYHEKRSEAA